MNADLGSPRELTGLQRRRALYQPELPPCLQVYKNLPSSAAWWMVSGLLSCILHLCFWTDIDVYKLQDLRYVLDVKVLSGSSIDTWDLGALVIGQSHEIGWSFISTGPLVSDRCMTNLWLRNFFSSHHRRPKLFYFTYYFSLEKVE